jgi:hypothetical protein
VPNAERRSTSRPPSRPISASRARNAASTARTISVTASDRLRVIDEAYAQKTAASDRRIDDIIERSTKANPTTAAGQGTAPDAAVKREHSLPEPSTGQGAGQAGAMIAVNLTGELVREQGHRISDAITTLIETVTVGQAEATNTAERLNDLTHELVIWTRVIVVATIIAVVVAIAALWRGAG